MKLPETTEIKPEKITDYLLKPRTRNDKSKFLNLLGYQLANWNLLRIDILNQFLRLDADFVERTEYGSVYEIKGNLTGPNGRSIKVLTIWMYNSERNQAHLITLYPLKEL